MSEAVVVIQPEAPEVVTTLDGVELDPLSILVLRCIANARALTVDATGAPLQMGQTIEFANRAQRRAIAVRDGGCVFPGCDRPAARTDAHHVHHRKDHGPTDIGNLAGLCRFHHRVTHRPRWQMHATDDQWFWWRTPSGATFWSQRHGRPRAGPTPSGP